MGRDGTRTTGRRGGRAAWLLAVALAFAGPAAAATTEGEGGAYYEDALVRFGKGEYAAAIIQLKNALQEDPNNLAARILIGRAYIKVGAGPAAEKEIRRAREAGADDSLTIVPLGESYLMQRKFDEILEDVRSGGRATEIEAQILHLRGQAHLNLGKLKRAEKAFAAALRLDREYADAILGRARVQLKLGKLAAAEALIDRAREVAPNNVDAWYLKGESRRTVRDLEGAVAFYGKAADLQPGHLPSRTSRAAVLLDLGRVDAALEDVEFVREMDQADPHAAFLHAQVLARKGRHADARAALKDAEFIIANYRPGFVETHLQTLLLAAMVHYTQRNYPDAKRYADIYMRLDPYHPGARKIMGRILLREGNAQGAIQVLRPALRVTSRDPSLLALLGTAMLRDNRHAEATEMLERALELAPKAAGIRTQLGLSRLAAGKPEQAVEELETALELDPDSLRSGLVLAMIHLRNQRFDEALQVAERIAENRPNTPAPHNFAGAALLGKGDMVAARARLEKALEIDPDFRPAQINLARLDTREGDIESARRRYAAILENNPEDTGSMLAMARIAESQKDTDEAIRWLEKVRNVDRTAIRTQLHLVDLYVRSGRMDTAAELAREIRQDNPETPALMEMVGRAEMAIGQIDKARNAFFSMAELSRDSPQQLLRAAELQLSVRDEGGAHRTLSRAVTAFPDFMPAQVAIVRLEARIGREDTALARVEDLRKIRPADPLVDTLHGDALAAAGRHAEAAKAYGTALESQTSSYLVVRYYRAVSRSGSGPVPVKLLEDWVKENPEDGMARRALAGAYADTGRKNEAIAAYEALLEDQPDNPAVLNNLAWLYHERGDGRALELAEQAYALAPSHPAALDTLGWILVQGDDPGRGLALLREAQSRASQNTKIRYHIAVGLSRLGRNEQARRELEAVLADEPEADFAADARALLKRLEKP